MRKREKQNLFQGNYGNNDAISAQVSSKNSKGITEFDFKKIIPKAYLFWILLIPVVYNTLCNKYERAEML